MNIKEHLIQSIMAGICIGLGGAMYLNIESKVIGSFFFGIGLFTICTKGFHLFTGRVAAALDMPFSYSLSLIITWFGNLIGTFTTAFLLSLTRTAPVLIEKAQAASNAKLNDTLLSAFILAIFCNVMVYIAVDGYKNNPHEIGKYIGMFFCVSGFILAGFEHCIANMFYFSMAGAWSMKAVLYLLVMTLGNIIGGLLIPASQKLLK